MSFSFLYHFLPSICPTWIRYYTNYFFQMYQDTVDYLLFAITAVGNILAVHLLLGIITYVCQTLLKQPRVTDKKRALFIIAHPDDEVMFFGPTILRLKDTCEIHLLCLSMGNHLNRGQERKQELWDSCKVLGIPISNITLMNNTRMPDDPDYIWKCKRTARIILTHIEALDIETVYTFDVGGVSGHNNHTSIYYACARLCLNEEIPENCKVYLLESVNKLRKYSGPLDAALSSAPFGRNYFVVTFQESSILREAMKKHRSQLVWFRHLYILFSRYMYMNTYKELEMEDVQLVLQMADYNPLL